MNGIPAVLKQIRSELADLHRSIDVSSEAQAETLHRIDALERCVRVTLKLMRHVHGMLSRANARRSKPSGVRKKRPRGVH